MTFRNLSSTVVDKAQRPSPIANRNLGPAEAREHYRDLKNFRTRAARLIMAHYTSSRPPFVLPPYGPSIREEKDVFTIEKEEFVDLLCTLGHMGTLDTEGLWRLLKRSKLEVVQSLLYGSGVSEQALMPQCSVHPLQPTHPSPLPTPPPTRLHAAGPALCPSLPHQPLWQGSAALPSAAAQGVRQWLPVR